VVVETTVLVDDQNAHRPRPRQALAVGGHLLAQDTGFYSGAFGEPGVLKQSRPDGVLGPQYVALFSIPGERDVRQELYPYADESAVVYTPPGQSMYGQSARVGWYRAPGLKATLVAAGLPARASTSLARPAGASADSTGRSALAWQAPAALALLAVASVLALRRRR
jgi:hypothetical protein